jgi:hypothetical protein
MARIRRTFIAALVASAVTAATFGAAPSTAATSAASCTYSIWKITKRENVTCRKAKKVMKHDPRLGGEGQKLPGWHCTYGKTIIPEGKCSKRGTDKSFKYAPK